MRPAALLYAALGLSGCSASHVVVTVEDPDGVASTADSLPIGFEADRLDDLRPLAGAEFPLTFALAYHDPVMLTVWVEARVGALAVARGSTPASLEDKTTAAITLRLGRACVRNAECSDN